MVSVKKTSLMMMKLKNFELAMQLFFLYVLSVKVMESLLSVCCLLTFQNGQKNLDFSVLFVHVRVGISIEI